MTRSEAILDQLDKQELTRKLEALDCERRAVMVLLRAARASERAKQKTDARTEAANA